MIIPHLFRCPISLELLMDPVTLCTGQTYDRSSIERWLAAGNLTCPVTMQKLHDPPTIIPNHTLRHLIDQWLEMGHRLNPDYLSKIDALTALKRCLESNEVTLENKQQALEKTRVFLGDQSNLCAIQLGFFPLLLGLLFAKIESEISQEFVEEVVSCVLSFLPFGEMEHLNILKEEPKFESFLVLFEKGSELIKKSLCQIVEAISKSSKTKEAYTKLGANDRFLQAIITLVHNNSNASDSGVNALLALTSLESNHQGLIQKGAMNALITYITNAEKREKSLSSRAVEIVERLLRQESAKEALISNPNGINVLVKMVFRVSDHEGSESAMNSLTILCYESLEAREEAICGGVLTQLLLLLQSQCNGRTKTKARMLLNLLRSK